MFWEKLIAQDIASSTQSTRRIVETENRISPEENQKMSEFISRKQLEIHHSKSYEMRDRLKQLGCEWDPIARAWIAPSTEVRELCYEILEKAEEQDSWQRPYFGRCAGGDITIEDLENFDKPRSNILPELSAPIAYTPTREDAVKISGEENVLLYWRSEISNEAAAILASGENVKRAVYDRLEDVGWKARSVSLLWDIVEHFRNYPPMLALDEKVDTPIIKSESTIDPQEMQGSISVITDSEGEPALMAIAFPYDPIRVNMIKWIRGRRWNPSKKRWEVPIEQASEVFKTFPHFQRSPKTREIELQLLD